MLRIGGKGGGGVGQLLAAVAAALLLRLFSGSGPELLPEDAEENDQVPAEGKVAPVTVKWANINCSLSDKSSKFVSELHTIINSYIHVAIDIYMNRYPYMQSIACYMRPLFFLRD